MSTNTARMARAGGRAVAVAMSVSVSVVLAGGGAARAAGWAAPFDVASVHPNVPFDAYGHGFGAYVSVGSGGGVTAFAWTDLDAAEHVHVLLRTRTDSGGALGPIHDLGAEDAIAAAPLLAVARDGSVVVAWAREALGMRSPIVARRLVAGRLGPPVELGSGELSYQQYPRLDVVADAGGGASFARVLADKRVQLQALAADGVPGPVVTVPTPDLRIGAPSVAIAASGRAVVAWDNAIRGGRRLYARTASTDGTIGPIVVLWHGRGRHVYDRAIYPDLGISDAGDALVAWDRSGHGIGVQARFLTAGGRLGPTIDIAPSQFRHGFDVIVAAGGRGAIVWQQGRRPITRARLMSVGGRLGRAVVAARAATFPALSLDPAGRVLFAWSTNARVLARRLSANGTLEPIASVAAHGERAQGDAYERPVERAAGSSAVVTWQREGDARIRR